MRRGYALMILLFMAEVLRAAAPVIGTSAEVFGPRNFPGWQSQNVCFPFVLADGGTYRMYYSGSGSEQWNDSNWDLWVSGYATSTDTTTWKVPDNYEQVLFARRYLEADLLDPSATAAVFDSVHAVAPCIIKDETGYRLWYTGWNGETVHRGGGLADKVNFRIGYATSSDCVKWTKVPGTAGGGAVLGLGSGTEYDSKGASCPFVLNDGGTFRMWYEGYDGTARRILYATSSDGVNWTKRGLALDRGGVDAKDELGAAVPMVLQRKNRYELWYQGQSRSMPNYHILRATSNDGVNWSKLDEVTLHPTPPVSGSERLHVRSAIVQPDGKVQVFFAKEKSSTMQAGYWLQNTDGSNYHTETVGTSRKYSIFTEVVNPNP